MKNYDIHYFNYAVISLELEIDKQRKRVAILKNKSRYSNTELPKESEILATYSNELSRCSQSYEDCYIFLKSIENEIKLIKEIIHEKR